MTKTAPKGASVLSSSLRATLLYIVTAASVATSVTTLCMPTAHAQSAEPPMNPKDSVEAPPRPEPPYPGSEDIDLTPATSAPPQPAPSQSQRQVAPPAAETGTWAGHLNKLY